MTTRAIIGFVLLVGPAVSVLKAPELFAHITAFGASVSSGSPTPLGNETAPFIVTLLLFWSPLPFSIPALLLQDERDEVLAQYPPLVASNVHRPGVWARVALRSVLLLPALMFSARSRCRPEAAMSLAGFLLACAFALPVLAG